MDTVWFLQAAVIALTLGMIAGGALSVVGWIVVASLLLPTIALAATTAGLDLGTTLLVGVGLVFAFNTGLVCGIGAKYIPMRPLA